MKKPTNRFSTTRRRLLKLAALAIGGAAVGGSWHAYDLQVTRKDVWVPALPSAWEGTRLLHLSDIHRGPFVKDFYLEKVMEQARGLSYDMVALTGDFISWNSEYAKGLQPLLSNLNAPLGAWAVLGNHDHYDGPREVSRSLRSAGISVLSNSSARLQQNGQSLWIAGVDDMVTRHDDLKSTLKGVDPGVCTILLSHTPDIVLRETPQPYHLVLSGHTHGGQVCTPDGMPIFTATSVGIMYAGGIYPLKQFTLVVSRGVGLVAPPFRAWCPPEIALLRLRRRNPS